jgi:hypothetical protein
MAGVASAARRGLVPFEVAAVIAAAAVPLPVPAVLPLLIVAAVSLTLRGKSLVYGTYGAGAGALAGLAALVIAELVTGGWNDYPVVRGAAAQAIAVGVLVGCTAAATEMVLRGWIVERVRELGGAPVMAVLVGAIAEALITPGGVGVRIGAGCFGIGLGWMYIRAGMRAPLCARLVFALGAVLLAALGLV